MVAYTQQTWANDAAGNTPLNAVRLNHMEIGIKALATATTAVENQIPTLVTDSELVSALAGKQNAGDYATNSALTSGLAGKSNTGHHHLVADIDDFTTAVDTAVQAIVGGAPGALDTLNELAAAIGDNPTYAASITAALAERYTKLESDARYYTQAQVDAAIAAGEGGVAGVSSINGMSGIVVLDAAGVGARPDTYVPSWAEVTNKPVVFPPDVHTTAQISDFDAAVDAAIQTVVGGAPGALDTLNELAAAMGDDANFAATMTAALNARYTKAEADNLLAGKATLNHLHDAANVSTGIFADARIPQLPQSKISLLTTDLAGKVPTSRTIAGKSLSSDISLAIIDIVGLSATLTNLTDGLDSKMNDGLAGLPGGMILAVKWSGTDWEFNGAPIVARPSARTDLVFEWIGGTVEPPLAISGDLWLEDTP